VTVQLLLAPTRIEVCENVKLEVFFNVILAALAEKFSIFSSLSFFELTKVSEKSKKVELRPIFGIIELPFRYMINGFSSSLM
jgi:hypothetical protein